MLAEELPEGLLSFVRCFHRAMVCVSVLQVTNEPAGTNLPDVRLQEFDFSAEQLAVQFARFELERDVADVADVHD